MRVTNEQAIEIRDEPDGEYPVWRYYDEKGRLQFVTAGELATDILDSRETIEKQEELINEMREVLNATRKTYSNEIFTLAKMRIDEVLEKTKEYTE